jgi:AraC-like DNA-binding protein
MVQAADVDRMPLKTVSSLLRVVVDQGYPLQQALDLIGLDFNPLVDTTDHPATVPTANYSRLYRLLMSLLQDEAFGLGQDYRAPPGTFRMMCLFLIHCATLEQALLRSREFHDYCDQYRQVRSGPSPDPIVPLGDGEYVLCVFQRNSGAIPEGDRDAISHANVLLMMYRFYSWLIGKPLPLQEVHLRVRAPGSRHDYERLFDCPVKFGQANSGLVLPAAALLYPVAQNEETLRDFLREAPYPLVRRREPGRDATLARRVEHLLERYASRKLPGAGAVARELNMSTRTLHRRLTAEGASFQQIKDDFRRELAVHYISRPELSIDAIAALMGFQDSSAFYRSFKKWTGVSPGRYRAQLDGGHEQGD